MTRRSRRALHAAVDAYLAFRRSLGFSLGAQDKPLHDFASFVDADPGGAGVVTTDLAVRWATRNATASPRGHANRLSMVRGFAEYWKQHDPSTQVPPTSLFPAKAQRRSPVLLEDDEVQQLMLAAPLLRTISPLWRATVTMIIGLLAVTGMRIGEVVSLDDDDVDWDEGILTVKRAKFGKSRLVPLHRSTTAALRRYVDERGCTASTSAMFWAPHGGPNVREPCPGMLRWSTGTGPARTWARRCLCFARTSGTSTSTAHTGTCPPPPNSSASPAIAWSVSLRGRHEVPAERQLDLPTDDNYIAPF